MAISNVGTVTGGKAVTAALAGVCNVGYLGGIAVSSAVNSSNSAFSSEIWAYQGTTPLNETQRIFISLESMDGSQIYGETYVDMVGGSAIWAGYHADITIPASPVLPANTVAMLCYRPQSAGTIWIAQPSLTPVNSYKQRYNGMRAELATMVADMHPAALRFPGGCFVEGLNRSTAWNFTTTVGSWETRSGHYNLWQYWSNDRAGMYEYLQWAEDMNAVPIWVLNAGIFDSSTPVDPVQPWIDHALASMEFEMGDGERTFYGAIRAEMGHPDPFQIPYVAIGNENGGEDYVAHYQAIYSALKAAYPDVKYIANSNISSASTHIDLFDYHTYPSVDWFFEHQWDWDTVQQRGDDDPKVFNSEYASKNGAGVGNLFGALGEAAWAIGLERNSDVVTMAAYAPLLSHVNDTTWLPDAIMFNNTAAYGTPSYYLQKLFGSNNAPASTLLAYNLTASAGSAAPSPQPLQPGTPLFNNGVNFSITVSLDSSNATAPTVVIKMVNYASTVRSMSIGLMKLQPGWSQPASGMLSTIASPTSDLQDTNDFDHPYRVAIVDAQVDTAAGSAITLPAYSIHVLRMELDQAGS